MGALVDIYARVISRTCSRVSGIAHALEGGQRVGVCGMGPTSVEEWVGTAVDLRARGVVSSFAAVAFWATACERADCVRANSIRRARVRVRTFVNVHTGTRLSSVSVVSFIALALEAPNSVDT